MNKEPFKNRIVDFGSRPATSFVANPANFREHPAHQLDGLRGALAELGWIGVVIENRTTGRLIDGHARITEALKRGPDSAVPFVTVELTEDEERLALATFDPVGALARTNEESLRSLLIGLSAADADLQALIATVGKTVGIESITSGKGGDEFSAPLIADARSRLGETWRLGRHRLFVGDFSEMLDKINGDPTLNLKRGENMNDRSTMIFSDPPYGISIVKGNSIGGDKPFARPRGTIGRATICAANTYLPVSGDHDPLLAAAAFELINSRFPKAAQIWWGANHYAAAPPSSCWLVWNKETGDNKFADCELAYTNSKRAVRMFTHRWAGLLRDSERGKRCHPTQKPIALVEWCLDLFDETETIIDPFAGSGITIIAAERHGKTVRAAEIEPLYCDLIIARWEAETGRRAELVV